MDQKLVPIRVLHAVTLLCRLREINWIWAPSCQRNSRLRVCVRPTELISMKVTSVDAVDTLYLPPMKISCLRSVLVLQYYATWHLPHCLKKESLWGNVMIPELKIKLSHMGLDYSIHCLPHRRTESRVLSPQDHISAPRAYASVKPISRFGLGREFLCSLGRAGKDCQGFGWCPLQCRLWSPKSPGWFKPWATFFSYPS